MKSVLFIILTILVHNTIQYEHPEEVKILHTEKPPERHEDDLPQLRRGGVKDLVNVNDYDTEDSGHYQPHSEHYQNSYREDGINGRPWRVVRSGSNQKLNNWMTAMMDMRKRKSKGRYTSRKPKYTRPTYRPSSKKPTKTTRPHHYGKTTNKDKNGDELGITIDISASIEVKNKNSDSTEEEKILLQYSPQHKKADVPMIIFEPSKK